MKRVLMITAALAVLALPLTGVASAKTSKADKREARQECKALRGDTAASREAFKAQFKNFGQCVNAQAKEAKAERKAAHRNAARDCRDERTADPAAFKEKYGTNGNKSNAFGKCVSQKAKAKREQQDEADAQEAEDQNNAAQECATERSADRKAFEEKYGSNHNKKNAFGKCVSQKVHEAGDDGGEDGGS
jgi:hypothetical protein